MAKVREGTTVVAVTEIPAGAHSAPFSFKSVLNFSDENPSRTSQVGVWANGEIRLASSHFASTSFWPRRIPLAPDCHVQNVRIISSVNEKVILQATRTILPGQELSLWFSEDILILLDVTPFLSPINIKGGNCYMCQSCDAEFEAPNPLKIHMALSCGTMSMNALWEKLGRSKCILQPPFFSLRFPSSSTLTPRLNIPQSKEVRETGNVVSLNEQQAHLESLVSNMGKAKNGHVCLYCGKLYSRKYGLKIHIRTHTGFKPLECKICHRPFGDPSNLNKHVRLHSDSNTPYRCEYCGKLLVRRRDLERHIRSRHTNRNGVLNQDPMDCSLSSSPLISLLPSTFSNSTVNRSK